MTLKNLVHAGGVAAKNMILGGNLIAAGLAKDPREMVLYATECLFLYDAVASKRGIPQKNVFEVLRCEAAETITLGLPNSLDSVRWFGARASRTADVVSLCLLCRVLKPKVVFEIGTFTGFTALHFALNTPETTKVYTLDLPKGKRVQPKLGTTAMDASFVTDNEDIGPPCFENSPVANKVTQLYGDSATFDFSPFYGTVDLFFIDGAHHYDYVRSDTLNAAQCCHPGSVIAWHDFGRAGVNGVSKWLREWAKTHRVFSIPGGSLAFTVVDGE